MKVKIEIDGSNEAFWDRKNINTDEFDRILKDLVTNTFLRHGKGKHNLRDINGNVCGFIEISEG